MNIFDRFKTWLDNIIGEMPHELQQAAKKAQGYTEYIEAFLNTQTVVDFAKIFGEEPLREEIETALQFINTALVNFNNQDANKALLGRAGGIITSILHGKKLNLGKYIIAFESVFTHSHKLPTE